ncbi:MAG: hypothetical protein ACLFRT_09465 [Actinomycetota bacterium]
MFHQVQWKRAITVMVIVSAVIVAFTATARGSDDVPRSLEEAVAAALEGWSGFATTGNLSAVSTSFALGGPQFRQFEVEANAGGSKPDAGALEMKIRDLRLRRRGSTTATVWARIQVSRAGHIPEVGSWDFDLINEEGRWLVWTVVPAEPPPTGAAKESSPPTTLARSTTTLAADSQPHDLSLASAPNPEPVERTQPSSLDGSTRGVRIPALSAWIIVVTLVGVAAAGYLAPRVDRRKG